MQQSLTITIDQNLAVYYAGMSIGTGEDTFMNALDEVPVNMVEKITVRDERDPQTCRKWVFHQPHEFDNLRSAIEFFPAEDYTISAWEQADRRRDEQVYLDPEFLDLVHITQQEEAMDYMPKPRKPKDIVTEPEPAPEPETAPYEHLEEEPVLVEIPEPEPEPEPEPVKVKERLVKPEDAEDIDFTPDHRLHRNLSAGAEENELLREFDDIAAVNRLPKGVTEGQAYLPGERLEVTPIAEKRARFKVHKKRSKAPLYVLGALLAVGGLGAFANNGGFSSAKPYTSVCIDARTQLVTNAEECKSNAAGRKVVYVPSEDAGNLQVLNNLPESAVFDRPSGKVEIKDL